MIAAMMAALFASADSAQATGDSITEPDTGGWYTSLALDGLGNPVVSYQDGTNGDLKVLHCNDANCVGGGETITAPDTGGFVGLFTSLALDGLGNPVVSYYDDIPNGDLKVLHCNDPNCAGGDESITAPDAAGNVGLFTSLALDGANNPVVSYRDETNDDLKVLHCNDPNCAGGGESITSPDTGDNVGSDTSLALDGSGNPVVSYWDVTYVDLKVLHCNDPNCAGGDESITAPDAAGSVGYDTSLALDAAGNPVISYYDATNFDLKVLHCNDANCAGGGESLSAPDTAVFYAESTSLALDAAGNPVVSYLGGNLDLKVLHCNDANCTGGDESVTAPDTSATVGFYSSLALDAAGNPVVSYSDSANGDLKVAPLRQRELQVRTHAHTYVDTGANAHTHACPSTCRRRLAGRAAPQLFRGRRWPAGGRYYRRSGVGGRAGRRRMVRAQAAIA